MLTALDEAAVGRWSRAAVVSLRAARGRIDELNVFPVPDGDTGTNLLLTAESGAAALADGTDGESVWSVLARGAVLGARGNSGAILAQLLRGLADALAGRGPVDGVALAAALRSAAGTAYEAVADPAEGTFLTVARTGGEAAVAAVEAGTTALADVVRAAADGARRALHGTTAQLAALREAGVVDAGGAGWCVVLDALVTTVTGVEPDRAPLATRRDVPRAGAHDGHAHAVHQPHEGPGSEVQFLLADSSETAVDRLRTELSWLGDCLVVVGVDTPTGREWNVHVHVSDVGAALEAGIRAGRPHRIAVTPLAPVRMEAPVAGARAVVALVPAGEAAEGLSTLLAGEGVRVLTVPAGDGPAAVESAVLDAVLATGAADVVVLPNARELTAPVSRAAARAREEGREVAVVPTRSPLQGLSAVAVADPHRRFADDVIGMTEAAAATRWAEVTVAETEALTLAGRCHPGDALGVVEGEVVVVGPALLTVACELLDRLLSTGGELVTLVGGRLGDAVAAHLAAEHPTVEVTRHPAGPGARPLLIGVE
ncbi:DAK2 domain-containing protein [Modestobacter sp. Leaf380]|uniref:DAK2 domain-containing protein n=1 Tax=Modestobacter sp. Leaf380 TaxID=1736356 RepID=UPI0006F88545|nr:DAK2 domain-containing protein [Modestobacter sp. Leaf380]KQS73201.1 dihydroxyacetone kinase [Modestobacter sp. Leaf380]